MCELLAVDEVHVHSNSLTYLVAAVATGPASGKFIKQLSTSYRT